MNVKLFREIQDHILAEPRRLDMSDWSYRQSEQEDGPKCGTVGCIAVWAYILGNKLNPENPSTSREAWLNADMKAISLLQITEEQADRLFYMSEWPREFWLTEDGDKTLNAERTSERIEHFIKTKGAE